MFSTEGREAYPEIASAEKAAKEAEKALRAAMAARFPKGQRVFIRHHHGSYYGIVRSTDDCRVYVENEKTRKVTGRYPLLDVNGEISVEICD